MNKLVIEDKYPQTRPGMPKELVESINSRVRENTKRYNKTKGK